jgi:hypothetical protein
MSTLSSPAASGGGGLSPAGVLLCGTLEKMHGFAGRWVQRYYVLTEDCLHRFLRAKADSFFGKEIAHYDLARIQNPRVQERYICFDLVGENAKSRPDKRKIRCGTPAEAETWVVAIVRARKRMREKRKGGGAGGGGTPRFRRRLSGNYQDQSWSPITFGRKPQGVLPSPFSLKIQNADGTTTSKGNSLVPDEELCVGAILDDSVLVIEDHLNNRVVRFPLKSVAGVERCERELKLVPLDENDGEGGGDGGKDDGGGGGGDESKAASRSSSTLMSIDDEIRNVKLQLRFESDRRDAQPQLRRRRSTSSGGGGGSRGGAGDGGETSALAKHRHFGTLALSFFFVLASFLFFAVADVELTGPVRIWAMCMTLGTAVLGFMAFSDGSHHRRRARERAKRLADEEKHREVWRILYVALLDDAGAIARHNEAKMEEAKGEWDFDQMVARLEKKPADNLANPDLLADVGPEVETPQRFLNCEKDDPALARLRWRHTTWFRKKFGYLTILDKPHPLFHVIKKYWPNYYYGQDRTGSHPVFFDKPAGVDLKSLYKLGITDADLCYHYVWITEFCYNHLCKPEDDLASCITVYNMEGLDSSLVMGSKKKFIMKTMKIFEQHYPERTHKMYILNAPGWFNWLAWPIVKTLANEQTLEKIKCFSSGGAKFMKSISKLCDPAKLPVSFGGESCAPMDQSPSELQMRALAIKVCADHGVKMITEIELMDEMHRGGD